MPKQALKAPREYINKRCDRGFLARSLPPAAWTSGVAAAGGTNPGGSGLPRINGNKPAA